jgi:hypothetical protein
LFACNAAKLAFQVGSQMYFHRFQGRSGWRMCQAQPRPEVRAALRRLISSPE